MKLALFGVGNAGVRLVDQLLAAEQTTGRPFTDGNVLAFNTTESTFAAADHLTDKQQVLVGDTHPNVHIHEEPASGDDDRKEGVDGDVELAVSVANDDLPEIRRALDRVDDTEVDAAVVVAGLGGATGCGVGGVLLNELASIYEIPIYVLGVLPTSAESDRRAWTAARAIRTFVPMADAVIPIDNESWTRRFDEEGYTEINDAIATRFMSLFAAGEAERAQLSEVRIDPNDIIRTLGVGGVSTIGYAKTELESEPDGWLARLRRLLVDVPEPEPQTDAASIKQLVQRAVESELTLPCDIETADRILLILAGPPEELSRKGFETGRYLLEEETGTVEILAGDEPLPDATQVTATVLLANVTGVPRIEQLQQRAVAFQNNENDEAKTDRSTPDDAADDHGFQFDESTDPEALIKEAEATDGDTVDDGGDAVDDDDQSEGAGEADDDVSDAGDDETVDSQTDGDETGDEQTDDDETGDEQTDDDEIPSEPSADDEPAVKDPFAGESTADEPNQ